jgi:hypothetical protein
VPATSAEKPKRRTARGYAPIDKAAYPLCRRVVTDDFATPAEVAALRRLGAGALLFGGGVDGGVSLVDFNLGVVSSGSRFASLYQTLDRFRLDRMRALEQLDRIAADESKTPAARAEALARMEEIPADVPAVISGDDITTYVAVVRRIQQFVLREFFDSESGDTAPSGEEVDGTTPLYMASPGGFSRITARRAAASGNDEYWHAHIDTQQYGTFEVTTLLYLNTQVEDDVSCLADRKLNVAQFAEEDAAATDGKLVSDDQQSRDDDEQNRDMMALAEDERTFCGGSFEFVAGDGTDAAVEGSGRGAGRLAVAPVEGRLLAFTSGPEHPHRVQKVTGGARWAVTTAWTRDAAATDVWADTFPNEKLASYVKYAEFGPN